MNLFQLNTTVDSRVLKNAQYDIRGYITFISKSIDLLKRETLSIRITKKIVDIEYIKDGKKIKSKETRYSPEPANSKKTEKAIELLFNENTKDIFDQNKNFHSEHSIKVLEKIEEENYFTLHQELNGDTIYLKPDTYQLEKQKKALENLLFQPQIEHKSLLQLFGFPNSDVWDQVFENEDYEWKILTDETKDGLEEQREFVSKALQTKDFALLEGPPGSGKTTTIIELIMQFVAKGERVLLCSATHAAIDNVIERIKGRYKEICDQDIIPVRISRFEKPIKDNVRPYLLRNLVKTYKSDIEKHLIKNQELESQKFLLKNLYKKNELEIDPIEKIILDSANLVAGTMIGILQHPDIRANKQGAGFDILIVDEASKVTFSDFIVPALHAKRWILVGDTKQLSPYVEYDYVSENISTMLESETQKSIVALFELQTKIDDKKFDDYLKVYFSDQNPQVEKNLIERKDLLIEIVDENWEASEINISKINSADVVIAKNLGRVKQLLSIHIHVKSIFINGETTGLDQQYRQEYSRQTDKYSLPYFFDSRQEMWSEMVSSRLNQSFSFRNAGPEFKNIDRELGYLVPREIRVDINQIKRLVFPSILELLQNGIGKNDGQESNRVISDGFHNSHKNSRFVSLSYQHRMNPDIARTSKENFYENNLNSANTVLVDRGWKYALKEPAVKWISNNDTTGNKRGEKIINPKEAEDIERELIKFLTWAKDNPKADGENYEVAVLSFYLNQESELRRRIRNITHQGAFSKFHKNNTDIFLYTVDKFQGQEADLVLLGFTKFTRDAHFNSPNRLNVALTRARFKMLLFGNRAWFKEKAKLKALRDLASNFESTIRY